MDSLKSRDQYACIKFGKNIFDIINNDPEFKKKLNAKKHSIRSKDLRTFMHKYTECIQKEYQNDTGNTDKKIKNASDHFANKDDEYLTSYIKVVDIMENNNRLTSKGMSNVIKAYKKQFKLTLGH